jgi:hypothetical protein
MARVGRIIAVTLGLSVAGAIFGALAGVTALVLLVALNGSAEFLSLRTLQMLVIPAIIGASLGALGAPAIAWLLLRYVPLGKAIAWSTVGTVAGGVVGWTLAVALPDASPGIDTAVGGQVKGAVLGAVGGFLAAAIVLRLRASVGRASPKELERPAA